MRVLILLFALFTMYAVSGDAADIPAHPRDLKFKPLIYNAPKAASVRHVLSNGTVAFLVEDHALPLVNIDITIRTGSYVDPTGKTGLGRMVADQMRSGGSGSLSAEDFDEEVDFLAANLSCRIAGTSANASANFLSKDMDKVLALFFGMMRNPAFQPDRMDLFVSSGLQQLARRNDRTDGIERREWNRLLRGADHFSSRETTKESLESITREDQQAFHKRYYHPANFIFAISGDFNTEDMKARLESAMKGWSGNEKAAPVPAPTHKPVPGFYMVNKADVNQGRVSIGHLGVLRDHPDAPAIQLMNAILGGTFTSRITTRVRTDEGLAYSAYSTYQTGVYYDGSFSALFQSKSSSCAQAAAIVLEEIERIRTEKVSEKELATVKNSAIEVFPRRFSSARAVARTFARDEDSGRDPSYWDSYRDNLRKVTINDVLRVAKEQLHPDRLIMLAVGNTEDMLKGNPDQPTYSFQKLAGPGGVQYIPLPDPLTLEYPEQ